MWTAMTRKAVADIRSRPTQTISLFLILAAATLMLTVALNLRRGLDNPWERIFNETNGAHVWVYAVTHMNPDFPLERLPDVAGIEGVTRHVGPLLETPPPLIGGFRGPFTVAELPMARPEIGAPRVVRGTWFTGAPDELMMDLSLARERGNGVGDVVQVGTRRLRIVGLVLDPGMQYWSGYVPAGELQGLFPGVALDHKIGVRLEDPYAVRQFVDRLPSVLGGGRLPVRVVDWQWFERRDTQRTQIQVLFLSVFAIFALVAAVFILVNSASARVLVNHRDIGLLKAVGFTPAQVAGVFLMSQAGLALVAAVVGAAAGAVVSPALLSSAADLLRTTTPSAWHAPTLLPVIGGVTLLAALATLQPAIRAGRMSTVRAIGGRFGAQPGKASRVARLAAALRLPPSVVFGVKDAFANPVRAGLTVAVLALATVTATFNLSAEASMNAYVRQPALIGEEPFNLRVTRGDMPEDEVERLISEAPGVEAVYGRGFYSGRIGDLEVDVQVLTGEYREFEWSFNRGEIFDAVGEAIIGTGLATASGIDPGETITVAAGGQTLSLVVAGVFRQQGDNAPSVITSAESLSAAGLPLPPVMNYGVKLAPDASSDEAARVIALASGNALQVRDVSSEVRADLNEFRPILATLTLLLAGIAVAGTLTTVLLTTEERRREFGVMKAIGMTPGQVLLSVASGALAMAVAGLLIGLPFGIVVVGQLVSVIAGQLDLGTMPYVLPDFTGMAIVVSIMAAVGLLGAVLPAMRIARMQVTQAIRAE